MGVTTDLNAKLKDLFKKEGPNRIVHPEFLHLEHLENVPEAHRRLQSIQSRWGYGEGTGASAMGMDPGGN